MTDEEYKWLTPNERAALSVWDLPKYRNLSVLNSRDIWLTVTQVTELMKDQEDDSFYVQNALRHLAGFGLMHMIDEGHRYYAITQKGRDWIEWNKQKMTERNHAQRCAY